MTEFIKPINTSIEPNTDSKKCKKKKNLSDLMRIHPRCIENLKQLNLKKRHKLIKGSQIFLRSFYNIHWVPKPN